MHSEDKTYLQHFFMDVINYSSDDPLKPIDPITYKSPEGDNCLHIAAIRGDLRAVKLLVELGLNINGRGDMGNTPLHYARKSGQYNAVKFLISKGARPDLTNEFGEKALPS